MNVAQARIAARIIANRIVDGREDAYLGAMRIWKEVLDGLDAPIPDDLWAFKSNASAIEDCEWNAQDSGADHAALIATCRAEILRAAELLARTSHSGERQSDA